MKLGNFVRCPICKGEGAIDEREELGEEIIESIVSDELSSARIRRPSAPGTVEQASVEMVVVDTVNESKSGRSAGGAALEMKRTAEESDGKGLCFMCRGTGKTSEWVTAYEIPNARRAPPCGICYDKAQYGISSECMHFFCGECIRASLEAILEQGQFPAYCPFCRAEAKGPEVKVGRIEGPALSFLEQRGVISKKLLWRFMKQQLKGVEQFFPCPAKCGRFLKHKDPTYQRHKRFGDFEMFYSEPYLVPGKCICGAFFCVRCQELIDAKGARSHRCKDLATEADEKTKKLMAKLGKRCPNCKNFIQKNGGCNVMMCGTRAHGSLEKAIRNGGCGHQFFWDSGNPCTGGYTNEHGQYVSGHVISREERMRVMKRVGATEMLELEQRNMAMEKQKI